MTDAVLTVVGGRMVLSKVSSSMSSGTSYPVNGQQLMMQLDSVTSRLMDMGMTTEEENMETEQSQHQQNSLAHQQADQQQRSVNNTDYQCQQKCVLWEY